MSLTAQYFSKNARLPFTAMYIDVNPASALYLCCMLQIATTLMLDSHRRDECTHNLHYHRYNALALMRYKRA